MRIISKFRDYYDNAAAHGVDPNILYVRNSTVSVEYRKIEIAIERQIKTLKDNTFSWALLYRIPELAQHCYAFGTGAKHRHAQPSLDRAANRLQKLLDSGSELSMTRLSRLAS